MENASKALLIAAAVLIAILLISGGVLALKAGMNTNGQVDKVGEDILSSTEVTIGDIKTGLDTLDGEQEVKVERIIIIIDGFELEDGEGFGLDFRNEVEEKTINITARVEPENATNKKLKWSSSNLEIATISDEGILTLIKQGRTTITAKATDGSGVEASKIIIVE